MGDELTATEDVIRRAHPILIRQPDGHRVLRRVVHLYAHARKAEVRAKEKESIRNTAEIDG